MTEQLAPITAADLQHHFIEVYRLSDGQASAMVASAASSLREAFAQGEAALLTADREMLTGFGHTLKGLFLNMGQPRWADKACCLEKTAKGEYCGDPAELVALLKDGVDVLVRNY